MNKKGFTLVELLAVIAILAILMLLIMPNVLNMFNEGKKDTFKVQVESIIKAAERQNQVNVIGGGSNNNIYCDKIDSCTSSIKLDVTDSGVKYLVKLNASGEALSVAVQDTNYCYVTTRLTQGLPISVNTNDFVANGELSCTGNNCECTGARYVYWSITEGGDNVQYASNAKPSTTYNSISGLRKAKPVEFIKTRINDAEEVVEHETCLEHSNGKVFCIKPNYFISGDTDGTQTRDKLRIDMENAFGVAATSCNGASTYADCMFNNTRCVAGPSGNVYCRVDNEACYVNASGKAYCKNI